MNPIIFAAIAALAFGAWTVFHKLASPHVNQAFGAILVSLVAVVVGSIWLIPRYQETKLISSPKGLVFLILAGVCAFFIDFLALQAYSRGLSLTIGGPLIIGGSIAVATIFGFFLGDSVTILKLIALALLVSGAALLAAVS